MELANFRLVVDSSGSCVPLRAVTPAEAWLHVIMHRDRAKKHPLLDKQIQGTAQSVKKPAIVCDKDTVAEEDTDIPATFDEQGNGVQGYIVKKGQLIRRGTVLEAAEFRPRTALEELARLKGLYLEKYIVQLFPSPSSKVPETFAEAESMWSQQAPVGETNVAGATVNVPGPFGKLVAVEKPIIQKAS